MSVWLAREGCEGGAGGVVHDRRLCSAGVQLRSSLLFQYCIRALLEVVEAHDDRCSRIVRPLRACWCSAVCARAARPKAAAVRYLRVHEAYMRVTDVLITLYICNAIQYSQWPG